MCALNCACFKSICKTRKLMWVDFVFAKRSPCLISANLAPRVALNCGLVMIDLRRGMKAEEELI